MAHPVCYQGELKGFSWAGQKCIKTQISKLNFENFLYAESSSPYSGPLRTPSQPALWNLWLYDSPAIETFHSQLVTGTKRLVHSPTQHLSKTSEALVQHTYFDKTRKTRNKKDDAWQRLRNKQAWCSLKHSRQLRSAQASSLNWNTG